MAAEFRLPGRNRLVYLCAVERMCASHLRTDGKHTGDQGGFCKTGEESEAQMNPGIRIPCQKFFKSLS